METPIKRSMVFIDAANLRSAWNTFAKQRQVKANMDYTLLLALVTHGTDTIRGYYYDAVPFPISHDKQNFFDTLRTLEITIVTKNLRHKSTTCRHCGTVETHIPYQKGVDVALVTDIMGLSYENAYDVAILVSGDGDFVDALNYLKTKGKNVWVASFKQSLSDETMRAADRVILLDDLFQSLVLQERKV